MVIIPGYKTSIAIHFEFSPVKYDRLRKNASTELRSVYLYPDETVFVFIAHTKGVLFYIYHSVFYLLVPL